MSSFGTSPLGVEKILERKPALSTDKSVGKTQSISQFAHDLQVRQTQGKDLIVLGESICEIFQQNLLLENVSAEPSNFLVAKDTNSTCIVSLQRWTAENFIKAGQQTYFGEALSIINPALPQILMEFDDMSWQVFYQYPKFMRRRLNKISGEILDALRRYVPRNINRKKTRQNELLSRGARRLGHCEREMVLKFKFLLSQ